MSIDTEDRPTNVKDLVFEKVAPSREGPFDPRETMLPDEIEVARAMMGVFADKLREGPLTHSNFQLPDWIVYIFPDQALAFQNDTAWENMKRSVQQTVIEYKAITAASVKHLTPKRASNGSLLDEEDWAGTETRFNELQSREATQSVAIGMLAQIRVLDPIRSTRFKLQDATWESELQIAKRDHLEGNTRIAVRRLSNMRLADPDRFKGILDSAEFVDIWGKQRKVLDEYRGANKERVDSDIYWDIVSTMVLAAQKIEINDQGVILVMPTSQSPIKEPPEVPKTRKY